ncbi:MAG TPA: hypothetical protein VKY74_23035 [Chloroflexia bacterium]|nr:hypothetical protein [Chloroflexia bacterium]
MIHISGNRPEPESRLNPGGDRTRGGCLTTYILVAGVLTVLSALGALLLAGSTTGNGTLATAVHMPAWYLWLSVAESVVYVGMWVGLWRWKRWSVYGLVLLPLLDLILTALARLDLSNDLFGLLLLLPLAFLLPSRWESLE